MGTGTHVLLFNIGHTQLNINKKSTVYNTTRFVILSVSYDVFK